MAEILSRIFDHSSRQVACRHAISAVVQLACSPYSDPLMSNLGRPRPAARALRLRAAPLAARQLCCEACPSDRQCIVGRIKFLCRWPAGLVQQFPLGASTGCTVLFRCGRSLGALVAGSVVARGVIKKDLIEAEVEPRWSGTIQIIGSASLGPLLPVCGGCCEDLRRLRKMSAMWCNQGRADQGQWISIDADSAPRDPGHPFAAGSQWRTLLMRPAGVP
jgi:hypothetical protein